MWNKISLKSLEKRKNKKYIIELLLEKNMVGDQGWK